MIRFLFILIASTLLTQPALAWKQGFIQSLKNGSAYVESQSGEVLFDHRSHENFIPASTIKIATSYCALNTFGKDYHFPTDFLQNKSGDLIIRGYGDPFLVSEEFPLIVEGLKRKGLKQVRNIILDTSFFDGPITIDGSANSSNPYDALNGPLVANFNTVYFHKHSPAKIISAEPQTPITPIAVKTALKYAAGKHRVNLGKDPKIGARYFGELLQAFLKQVDIPTTGEVQHGKKQANDKLLYRHNSSKPLSEVVSGLLKYSTNFMANQLFLALGTQAYGAPANAKKAQQALEKCLREDVGWKNFQVIEGAGLSRKNQVSAQQMMTLLKKFAPYRTLLPTKDGKFQAKTGTLTGANTYAGYMPLSDGSTARFVILVNASVPHNYKFKLAHKLYDALH